MLCFHVPKSQHCVVATSAKARPPFSSALVSVSVLIPPPLPPLSALRSSLCTTSVSTESSPLSHISHPSCHHSSVVHCAQSPDCHLWVRVVSALARTHTGFAWQMFGDSWFQSPWFLPFKLLIVKSSFTLGSRKREALWQRFRQSSAHSPHSVECKEACCRSRLDTDVKRNVIVNLGSGTNDLN